MHLATLAALVLLVLGAFVLSAWIGGKTVSREVRRSVSRGEPLPRIAGWWLGVLRRGPWLVGAGAGLVLLGVGLDLRGDPGTGQVLVLAGAGIAGYVLQAALIVRAMRKAKG